MPRRELPFRAGEYYHLYNRGNNRQPIYFERDNYLFFLRKLTQYVAGSNCTPAACGSRGVLAARGGGPTAEVIAFCLMPNHYHLLVHLRCDEFSDAMQSFGQSYTNAINKRQKRVGSLFQGRFQARHVDDDCYLLHLSRYIHLNPVVAGLVKTPEAWEFSSYREYAGLRGGSLARPEIVLNQFAGHVEYCHFVRSGIGKDDERIVHLLFEES